MGYALLADLLVALHLGYVLFCLVGEVLVLAGAALGWGWVRRRRLRLTHLICVVIVPVEAVIGMVCPLTEWEWALRRRAGQTPEEISFVGRLVRELLYHEAPPWMFTACYLAFGALVIGSWFWIPPRAGKRGGARAVVHGG